MALVSPNVGEVALLDTLLGSTTPEPQTLQLYNNDISPSESDTASTYTAATITGYSSFSLTRGGWNGASTTGGISTKTYPVQTTNFTGSGIIVGYFVTGTTSGTLLWSERIYTSPGQIFNSGDSLALTLSINLD